ncbi:hypothetical protein BDW62DRAFT_190942 [Aspergillus aurantiobrunneus]
MDLSYFHVNDLGLTPSPGFQLRDKSLQDKKHDCFDEHESANTAGGHEGIEKTGKETGFGGFEVQANNTIASGDYSYDPLFDSTDPELDSVFSRKRAAELPELPPEKRQHLESPSETPSLTTDSTQESPASFFDTFDTLFGSGLDLPLILPDGPLPDFEEAPPEPTCTPGISESTRERFLLDEQDILSNTTREVLQVGKKPEYASPYPVSGGPLGYLPSAPGIHVKCVAVGEEKKDHQILKLQAKLSHLTRERDQYKKSLSQYAQVDDIGKTPEQALREENAKLRRVSSRHQGRVEEYKKEAANWRNQLHVVSTLYNNLLYEIQVEKRVPSVASVPAGYKRPRMSTSVQEHLMSQAALQNGGSAPAPLPLPQNPVQFRTGLDSNSQSQEPTAQQFSHPEQRSQTVTIDLTEEEGVETPSTPPRSAECATLRSLRSKKYGWLQAGSDASKSSHFHEAPRINDDELALLMEQELSRA